MSLDDDGCMMMECGHSSVFLTFHGCGRCNATLQVQRERNLKRLDRLIELYGIDALEAALAAHTKRRVGDGDAP